MYISERCALSSELWALLQLLSLWLELCFQIVIKLDFSSNCISAGGNNCFLGWAEPTSGKQIDQGDHRTFGI